MAKVSDFRQKEVINIRDGKRLGFIYDMEFNPDTGLVEAMMVPSGRLLGMFSKEKDYVIPWNKIQKIGNDIILVDFSPK